MSGKETEAKGRAWITGAGGLIGSCLARLAGERAPHFSVTALARRDLDLTDLAAVERRFCVDRPRLVIHCAALSKSPDCQADPARARRVNVEATAHLAALAQEAELIFFSTDLVFDGRKGSYVESDPVNPLSVYAETKAAAENIVLSNPRHTVVRTSLNSGLSPAGNSAYNEQLCAAWREGRSVKLFFDEFRSPIPASVTARAVWELAASRQAGLYHLAGAERLSRVQLGQLLAARHPELRARMESCSLRDHNGAPRPPDTSLNSAKIQRLLSFPLPALTEWLAAHPEEPF
ncbi:MAG: SDR family oxidoreductase [Verrucomicrobiota bacterium]